MTADRAPPTLGVVGRIPHLGPPLPGEGEEGEARRRICQACFKLQAEHHCQACRRFVCNQCVAPREGPGAYEADGDCRIEDLLQTSLVRCRACRDEAVRLPPHDLEIETP